MCVWQFDVFYHLNAFFFSLQWDGQTENPPRKYALRASHTFRKYIFCRLVIFRSSRPCYAHHDDRRWKINRSVRRFSIIIIIISDKCPTRIHFRRVVSR